jgi:hypothetical protein
MGYTLIFNFTEYIKTDSCLQKLICMMHDRFVSVTIILLNNLKNPFLLCIEHFVYVALFSGFHILHVFCTIYFKFF